MESGVEVKDDEMIGLDVVFWLKSFQQVSSHHIVVSTLSTLIPVLSLVAKAFHGDIKQKWINSTLLSYIILHAAHTRCKGVQIRNIRQVFPIF